MNHGDSFLLLRTMINKRITTSEQSKTQNDMRTTYLNAVVTIFLLLFPPELVPPENHFHFSIQFFSLLKTPPSCLTLSETFFKELLSHVLLLQQMQKSFICKVLSIEKYWSSKYFRGGWMTNLELCSKYWRVLKSIEYWV